jgi:hypothetical protein
LWFHEFKVVVELQRANSQNDEVPEAREAAVNVDLPQE